ncbi:hypothetical protein VOM14_21395 [Paraburkholderia sp. MPAMCS5]|uniref:hypothetical protein n=1 Tax=Paraburkholderia sp. MPAMCS5 TaxID=3112563 RepID=UPI002E17B0BA|nr:hypothetical protein [Paraburkholderia sp. MPAMCS5]
MHKALPDEMRPKSASGGGKTQIPGNGQRMLVRKVPHTACLSTKKKGRRWQHRHAGLSQAR